jgi:uncharacterized protein (TIGR03437 family)
MTTTCCENVRRLVRWNIVFLKPGHERTYPEREELISSCMSEAEFRNWKIAELVRAENLPAADGCYLRVHTEVLRSYEEPPWDFESEQIRVLRQIRDALRGEHRHGRVRLPKTLRLAGALDSGKSEFGDEFVNMPDFLGEHPAPGHTFLTGGIEVIFSEPQGDTADFTLNWFATGTPVVITFGGGQQFDFSHTRTFPLPLLPNLQPVRTEGKLDLATGKVLAQATRIFATFQGTTIGRTDRVNRIPYAFPFIFPPLPVPEGFQPPPGYRPPQPMPPVFGDLEFSYGFDGSITGFALHSETIAPVGLFPYLPGFFPPFSFGPKNQFHFANPDRCLAGTPPQSCPNQKDSPDGILTSPSVYFHPHLDLVSHDLSEAPFEPPQPPPFSAASVLNAASLGMGLIGLGARQLSPGAMAVLVDGNLPGPGSPPDAVAITVDGKPAPVVGFSMLPPAVYFQIPPDLDPAKEHAELRLTRTGSPVRTAEIPIAPAAPGIFLYNFGEVLEPAYLDHAPSLACNEDQSLNYASQAARPGELVSLWATGLGKDPDKDRLKATLGGKKAAVEGVFPAPPLPPPFPPLLGVYVVQVRVPKDAQRASNSPVTLRSGDLASNRAAVAVWDDERTGEKVPCAYPLALGAAFPFLLPPPGK